MPRRAEVNDRCEVRIGNKWMPATITQRSAPDDFGSYAYAAKLDAPPHFELYNLRFEHKKIRKAQSANALNPRPSTTSVKSANNKGKRHA